MASLRDIRRRIKSVKNTAQITKAMQMVAASKMRKAQEAALSGRPYAELLNRVLVSLRDRVDPSLHPLLAKREGNKELVILLSTDKGLCGGLNTNLFREVLNFDAENTSFISVVPQGNAVPRPHQAEDDCGFWPEGAPEFPRDQSDFQIRHRKVPLEHGTWIR